MKFAFNKINAVCLLLFVVLTACTKQYNDYRKEVLNTLESISSERKEKLTQYLNLMQQKASFIHQDQLMYTFFKTKKEYYKLSKEMTFPKDIVKKIEALKKSIENHYLHNYLVFYDILFIDTEGEIFFTIRKEKDYHKNIFNDVMANTALSKKMRRDPSTSFVDFSFYEVSGEPSAFFIEPVKDSTGLAGWFVFQCAINKINRLFYADEKLGSTGEVILVNMDQYMLTDSRFKSESTILKQHLPKENISSKFTERKGFKEVIDYMGNKVLSSFEVFPLFDSEWLIIAKKNESEIITDYVLENRDKLETELHKSIINKRPKYTKEIPEFNNAITIDVDEFQRVDTNRILYTHGLSSCTGIIVHFPERFSYMAHVSPYDVIYNQDKTDVLGNIIKRISFLEIKQAEKHDVQITIVASHDETVFNIMDKLVQEGYFLSQIQFMYNPGALYANVYHEFSTGETSVTWKMPDKTYLVEKSKIIPTIEDNLKESLIR